MRGLHELLTTRIFAIEPSAAAAYRKVVEQHLNGHYPFATEKTIGRIVSAATKDVIQEINVSTETGLRISYYNDNLGDPFINVMVIDGPMTRAGDICSYGSADHRDMIMQNADNKNCVGHLFVMNSPGGSAWVHNDYQQAIDYAHSKGQPVVMWIDGICCSAAMWLASMCDEVYYMHPKDMLGSIGVMAMFYKFNDMDKNFNNETYRELYDPESYNKNEWYRKADGKEGDQLLLDDLTETGKEFRAVIKKAFSKTTDEMLHGATFDAEETKGIWTVGQSDYGQAFDRVIALAKKNGVPAASNVGKGSTPTSAIAIPASAAAPAVASVASSAHTFNQNIINMKKEYQNVADMLGIEQLAVKTGSEQEIENGSFLNTEQLDTIEAGIKNLKAENAQLKADAEKQKADSDAAAKQAQADFDKQTADMKAQYEKQIADLKAANEKALADAKTANDNASAEVKAANEKQVADLNAKNAELQKDIDAKQAKIAELEQSLKDRDEQMKEMGQSAGKDINAGNTPAKNGTGAKQVRIAAVQQVYDPSKPYASQMFGNNK